jgi:putative endonuclease
MIWCVYILQAENGSLYTGITNDLKKRLTSHYKGTGAKFFRSSKPKQLMFIEDGHDRSSAAKREYQIKQYSRSSKLGLIKDFGLQPIEIIVAVAD